MKTYFLAPTNDCPPSGPIALGNIIASPSTPEVALNPKPATLNRPIYESYKTNWTAEVGRYKQGKIGIWTKFLQALGIGIDLSVNYQSGNTESYSFDRIETRFFVPDQAYIETSVASPEVREFLIESKFRANLYMITGIKVAIGASIMTSKLRNRGVNLQFGVDGTVMGAPIGIGPDIEVSNGQTQGVSFDHSSDFVFAFRLREITYAKKMQVKHREYNKGALLGLDRGNGNASEEPRKEEEEEEEEEEKDFVVIGMTDEDVGAEELNLESSAVVDDDDDEACECVDPS